jgi:hypothetical protein
MGRRRRDGNHSPQKIIQYRIQREMKKIDTLLVTTTKKMIYVIKEPRDAHKNK